MQTRLQAVPAANPAILSVRNLSLGYSHHRSVLERQTSVSALANVSLDLMRGKTLALVGPSGCGKSSLARCLVLLEKPSSGEIWYGGRNLLELKPKELKEIRRDIHLIFQDSASALNPGMTIEEVLLEPLEIHEPTLGKKDRFMRLVSACEQAARRTERRPTSTGCHRAFPGSATQGPDSRRSSERARSFHAVANRELAARFAERALFNLSLHYPRHAAGSHVGSRSCRHEGRTHSRHSSTRRAINSRHTPKTHAGWHCLNRKGY
jgi:ABC-type glutathione transport system ATPase component